MKRTFQESPLIPFSKEDINGFFKTMGFDVQEIVEDYTLKMMDCLHIGEVLQICDSMKTKISEYFTSVKIK